MNKKFEKVCEEIIENEEKTKKFMKIKNPDEMFIYFAKEIPGLSEEEFDDFIVEILETYTKEKEIIESINPNILDNVSGGANLKNKLIAGGISFLSMLYPVVGATNTQQSAPPSSQTIVAENTNKQNSSKFSKFKKWIKDHPFISSGVTLAAVVASAFAIKKVIDKKGNPSQSIGKAQLNKDESPITDKHQITVVDTNATKSEESVDKHMTPQETEFCKKAEELQTSINKFISEYGQITSDNPNQNFIEAIKDVRKIIEQFEEAEKLYKNSTSHPDDFTNSIVEIYKQAESSYKTFLNSFDEIFIEFVKAKSRNPEEFVTNRARKALADLEKIIVSSKNKKKAKKKGKIKVDDETFNKMSELIRIAKEFARKSGNQKLISECKEVAERVNKAIE